MQASFLAYIGVFWTLMLVSAAAVPLALIMRKLKLGAGAPIALTRPVVILLCIIVGA